MSDNNIVSIKDFYNHETRISIVENAIISIDRRFEQVDKRFEQVDKRFEQVDKRFEQVDKRFEHLENKMDSQFKWMMGSFGGLALSTISILITLLFKLH